MTEQVREIFGRLGEREFASRLADVRGTYLFDVRDTGKWYVTITDGHIDVSEDGPEPDCVIECGPDDVVKIAAGEMNLLTALLRGQISARGDLALAQKFHSFVREVTNQRRTAQEQMA